MTEADLRRELVALARSLFERGFSVGSAGNISVALADGWLMTPTNSSLGELEPDRLSRLDAAWNHIGGGQPSKEVFLHRAFYESRPGTGAVVHLHSTYATALSCQRLPDPEDCVPALTPYVVMRVGRVPCLPYVPPGDAAMGDLIRARKGRDTAVLLANHGPVVAGRDLRSTVYAAEELEETAKLAIILRGMETRVLDAGETGELERRFAARMR